MTTKRKYILVVDDEETICELLCDAFEVGDEYEVRPALNGRLALDIAKSDPENCYLVISDFHMPQMDGLELLQGLHEELGIKPLFYLCSGTHDNVKDVLDKYENTFFVEKPYDVFELVDELEDKYFK